MSDAQSYTAPWDPNKFFAPRVHALLRTMRQCVDEILGSHTLAVVSELVEEGNKKDLKEWSHHGFIYRKKRSCDEGNYIYSVLFYWMLRLSENTFRGRATPVEAIIQKHPGLTPFTETGHDYNEEKLWGFQGDIIEHILAICREQGPAIPRGVAKDRQQCHDAIKCFSDTWDDVMHCLNRCYVACGRRPPTHNLVHELEWHATCVAFASPGSSSATVKALKK